MAEKGFMGGSMKFAVGEGDNPPEQVEGPLLPLRVLIVTALTPTADANAGSATPSNPIRLDLSEPTQLFNKVRPRIAIDVPSVLDGGKPTRLELAPTSLKSFRPDGMVQEIPLLRSLIDGKLILDRLRNGEINDDVAFSLLDRLWKGSNLAAEVLGRAPRTAPAEDRPAPRAAAAPAPAATPSPGGGGGLDALLDMVDVPGGGPAAAAAPAPASPFAGDERIQKIISEVALGGRARGGRGKTGIPMIEEAIGAQLGSILQHPEVRRLERSYRAVNFLLERSQRIDGVQIDVLGIPDEGAAAVLGRVLKQPQEVPFSFAVVDVETDGSARSLAEIETLAALAEEGVCPVIINGTEKLLGVGDLSRVDKIDNKQNLFTAAHRAPWRSTANKPSLRWLAIAMNGVLLRGPYDKQSSRVREAVIKEMPADHESFVWMAPAFAVASVCITSFKETWWPGRITGARHGQVQNLLVREIDDDGMQVAIPTQAFISTESQRELGRIGVLALASAPNSDAVYIHTAPTAYVQPDKKTYDSASTEPENRPPALSLVDQLFVARLVQFARSLTSKLPREVDPHEAQEILGAATWALFEKAPPSGPSVKVTVRRDADGPVASFSVEPRRFLGVSLDQFDFEMPIG
ncbi:MAG: type VI secretion system contractile sheath large subunit [Polyangiaceae bacterium]